MGIEWHKIIDTWDIIGLLGEKIWRASVVSYGMAGGWIA